MSENSQLPTIGKVLIAEDIEANRLVLHFLLESLNLEVIEAKDGNEAHQLFKKNTDVKLILMDVQMPVMNGVDSTILIRRWETFLKIEPTPIVAITAFDYVADIKRCMDAGMNDVIYKPVELDALSAVVEKYVYRREESSSGPDLTPQGLALEIINSHSEMIFNPDWIKRVVKDYTKLAGILAKEVMSAMPGYFELLKEAIEEKNWHEVQAIFHILKSQLRQIGSVRLSKIIESLNEALTNGGMIDLVAHDKIVANYEEFEKELRAWLRTHLEYV